MKFFKLSIVVIGISIITMFSSCSESSKPSESEVENEINSSSSFTSALVTLLPLGDSRVEGDRPRYESYRYELWKNYLDSDIDINFIGTNIDEASYPNYLEENFDIDHQGYAGATTSDILDSLPEIINNLSDESDPDVILLCIGGNDYLTELQKIMPENIDSLGTLALLQSFSGILGKSSDIIVNIKLIIETLQEAYPSATIVVEKIAPISIDLIISQIQLDSNAVSDSLGGLTTSLKPIETLLSAELESFYTAIDSLEESSSTEESKVISIDIAGEWKSDYSAPDGIHYNEAGAKYVADKYYELLESSL